MVSWPCSLGRRPRRRPLQGKGGALSGIGAGGSGSCLSTHDRPTLQVATVERHDRRVGDRSYYVTHTHTTAVRLVTAEPLLPVSGHDVLVPAAGSQLPVVDGAVPTGSAFRLSIIR